MKLVSRLYTRRDAFGFECKIFFSDNLTIKEKYALVEANSVWGLLRGLETFSQLVYIDQGNYVDLCPNKEKNFIDCD